MRSKLFALVIFFSLVSPTFAFERVDTVWVRYQHNNWSSPCDWSNPFSNLAGIAVDKLGHVYLGGSLTSYPFYNYDYYTFIYHPNGDSAFGLVYDGPGQDWMLDMASDTLGRIYVTGVNYAPVPAGDFRTVEYAPDGMPEWDRRYNFYPQDTVGRAWNEARAIAVDDSGVYVTGYSRRNRFPNTLEDYGTVKYDRWGNVVWAKLFNGGASLSDSAKDIAVDRSGNVYVTGASVVSGTTPDYATIKYRANGTQEWVMTYNGPADSTDVATCIAVDASGNIYVTGASEGIGTSFDYATVKYNPGKTLMWTIRYNGPGNSIDYPVDLAIDGSGNVYVTGCSGGSQELAGWSTIKYFPNGGTAWIRRYDPEPPSEAGEPRSLAVDRLGNVYVTGSTLPWGCYTIKYDSLGNELWGEELEGSDSVLEGVAVAVDRRQFVYVAGVGNYTGCNFFTIKYIQYRAWNYAAGDGPRSIFCGDLNGDLYPDLAVANQNSDNVSILLNNGDSTFQNPVNYPAGDGPYSVSIADLDEDGHLDLAVANQNSHNASVLINKGDGTFYDAVNYAVGTAPRSIFCADLNGDEDLDLAVEFR